MATRIIKLQNDSYTLLPVTDAKLVQMTVDGNTKSVYDVILEDEEVTAAGYNELNDRVETLETSYVRSISAISGTAIYSGVVTGATLEDNSSGGKNIKLTYTSLSTSDPSASGNSSTFIATISQDAKGKITATKKTVTMDLSSQSKDFGYVQSLTGDGGTGAGTSNTNKLCADAVKDTLQVKGGNKWITTGVSQNDTSETSNTDILYINHAINPNGSNKTVTTSGNSSLTHNSSLVITGISYNVDAAGHVKTVTATTGKLPAESNGFANVKTDVDETDITENTTKGTVAADTTTDTVTLRGGNKWITTGVNTTDDIAYINHKSKWTADGSITANASGATAAWSIDVVKGVTLSYDAAGHVTGLSVTSGKIPDNPNSDTKVTQSQCSTAGNYPVLFKHSANTTAETNTVNFDHLSTEGGSRSSFYFNPSTDKLFVDNLKVNYNLIVSSSNDENGGESNTYTHITSEQVHAPSVKGLYEYSDESPRRDYTGDYIDDNITVDDDITDIFIRLGEPDISGAHITTNAPSSTSTNETWPTSAAVYSAISPLSTAISTLQTTGIKLYGTTTKGPASNVAYTNGLTYIYSNGTNTYTIPAALSISGESEILESGDMFTYLESAKKWMVMDNNKDIATTQIAGTIKLAFSKRPSAITTNSQSSTASRYYGVEIDLNNKAFVNVPWTDTATTESGHYTPTGTTSNATKGTDGAQLTHNSSMVMTGINWKSDSKGHVTEISYTLAKLPADTNTDVKVDEWGKSDNNDYPVLFSYTASNASATSASNNFVASDTDGRTNFYYNPSTNTLKATNITSTNVTATKHITSNGTASQLVTGTGTLQSISGLYAANMTIGTSANYIKEPEFKTVKINGSTTNAASTNNCVLQYDTTNKCLNFVFN